MYAIRSYYAGDVGLIALPAAAAGMTVLNGDREGAKQLGMALLSTAAVTGGLKLSIREKAPNGDDHAFPSGHTSIAFAGASFLQRRYGWGYGAPAYLRITSYNVCYTKLLRYRLPDGFSSCISSI